MKAVATALVLFVRPVVLSSRFFRGLSLFCCCLNADVFMIFGCKFIQIGSIQTNYQIHHAVCTTLCTSQ